MTDFEINGPYNILRLEGNVNNINKVLYLFFDIHNSITRQSQCRSISLNPDQYLDKVFRSSKEITYDLFVEMTYEQIQFYKYNIGWKTPYIHEVRRMAESKIKKKEKKENGKTSKNKSNDGSKTDLKTNVRYHYSDIRQIYALESNNIIKINFISTKCAYYHPNDFNILENELSAFINQTDFIYQLFFPSNKSIKINTNLIKNPEGIKKNIHKILNKWNNSDIKHEVIKFYEDMIKYWKDEMKKCHKNILKELKILRKLHEENFFNNNPIKKIKTTYGYSNLDMSSYERMKYFKKLFTLCDDMMNILIRFHSLLTDIYFCRRFLDKKYIKNAIFYCGGNHGAKISAFLVNKFNFKITNASYLKYSVEKTNKIFKSLNKPSDFNHIPVDLTNPGIIKQCSSLKGFPKNLL